MARAKWNRLNRNASIPEKEIEAFFLSFYSLCQRQSYPTLDDMIVVGVKNKMMESKCREIYEEVKSAFGIVPSKAGKCDEAI